MARIVSNRKVLALAIATVSAAQAFAANNITVQAGSGLVNVLQTGNSFSSTDDSATIGAMDIQSAWGVADTVSITTETAGTDLEVGNITLNAGIDFNGGISSAKTLDLQAINNIVINQAISDSDTLSADKLALNLQADSDNSAGGLVSLAVDIGENLITTVSGILKIESGATYQLVNADDSLAAESIDTSAGGSLNWTAGTLNVADNVKIESGEFLGANVTVGSDQNLEADSLSIGNAAANSGSLTVAGGDVTVNNGIDVAAGGSLAVDAGTLTNNSPTSILNNGGEVDINGGTTLLEDINNLASAALKITAGAFTADSLDNAGSVDVTGGTSTIDNINNQTSKTINIAGGTLDSVAVNNSGVISQTNGASTIATLINTGDYNLSGGTAEIATLNNSATKTVDISGGTLDSVAVNNSGVITQTNGTSTIATLTNAGDYNLSGGTADIATLNNAAGKTVDITGGALNSDVINNSGIITQTNGSSTIDTLTNTGDYNLSGGTANIATLNNAATKTVDISGGTLNSVDVNNAGVVTQAAGLVKITDTLTLGLGSEYKLSGPNAVLDAKIITNNGGNSAFNWTQGTLKTQDLAVTDGGLFGDTLALDVNKKLIVTHDLNVGADDVDIAHINQTGGLTTVNGAVTIGANSDYILQNASLNAGELTNRGEFSQAGASSTDISGALNNTAGATINLTGGNLTAGSLQNAGQLNQGIGQYTYSGGMTVGASGHYTKTEGVLNTSSATIDGQFSQSSGSTTLSSSATINGQFTQTGGSTNINGATTVNAGATLSTSSGSLTTHGLTANSSTILLNTTNSNLAAITANSSTITLSGGNLSASSIAANTATHITQQNSNVSLADDLTLDALSTYIFNGGTFAADHIVTTAGSTFSWLKGRLNLRDGDVAINATGIAGDTLTLSNTTRQMSVENLTVGGATAGTVINAVTGAATRNIVDNQVTIAANGVFNQSGSSYYDSANYSGFQFGNMLIDGEVNQNGGSLQGGSIVINASGNMNLSGADRRLSAGTLQNFGQIDQSNGSSSINNMIMETGSAYNISGGSVYLGAVQDNGGDFNFTGGYLSLNSSLNVNDDGLLGNTLALSANKQLTAGQLNIGGTSAGAVTLASGKLYVNGSTSLNNNGSLAINGGNFSTDDINLAGGTFTYTNGGIDIRSGTIDVTAAGLLGDTWLIEAGEEFGSASMNVGDGSPNSGYVEQIGGSNTVRNTLHINAGGSYDLKGGNLYAGAIVNDGSFNRTAGGVRLSNSDMLIGAGQLLGNNVIQTTGEVFGSDNLTLMSASAFTQNGGQHYVDGVVQLNTASTYTLNGGYLSLSSFDKQGGNFVWTAGHLDHDAALVIGAGQAISGVVNLDSSKDLTVGSTLTVQTGSQVNQSNSNATIGGSLDLAGGNYNFSSGYLTTDQIVGTGTFTFSNGDLHLDQGELGASSRLGSSLSLTNTKTLHANNFTVNAGASLVVDSGTQSIGSLQNGGQLTVNGSGYLSSDVQNSGTLEVNSSGTLSGNVQNSGTLTVNGSGGLSGNVQNSGSLEVKSGASMSGNLTQTSGSTLLGVTLFGDANIAGGSLTGAATINGNLTLSSSTLNVGGSGGPSNLDVNGLTSLNSNSTVNFTVDSLLSYDQLFSDSFAFGDGTINFELSNSLTLEQFLLGLSFDNFFKANGAGYIQRGNAAPTALSFLASQGSQTKSLVMNKNGKFSLAPPPSVPVPASAWLMGSGLIGLVGVSRRKRVH